MAPPKKIDYKNLLRNVTIKKRMQFAKTSQGQALLHALTPIELAELFPGYYKKALPDLGARPTTGGGRSTTGGGGGATMGSRQRTLATEQHDESFLPSVTGTPSGSQSRPSGRYSGSTATPVARQSGQRAQAAQEPKLTAAEQQALSRLKTQNIAESDPSVAFLKDMSADKLKELGISKLSPIAGEAKFTWNKPKSKYESMSDDDLRKEVPASGKYRPEYKGSDVANRDLINIIGREAQNNQQSIDAVINNMMNRVASPSYGNAKTLTEVAKQSGQYESWQFLQSGRFKPVTADHAKKIEERIRAIASGNEPDITKGANEFRASSYVYGAGRGKTFANEAARKGAPNIGGNVYLDRGYKKGSYAAYEVTGQTPPPSGPVTDEQLKAYRQSKIQAEIQAEESRRERALAQQLRGTESSFNGQPASTATPTSNKYDRGIYSPGATRNMMIKPELKDALNYAAHGTNIEFETTSLGQTSHGARTGSNRHNVDNPGTIGAADMRLFIRDSNGQKQYLETNNPAHQKMISDFTRRFSSVAPSAGVGTDYMSSGRSRNQLFHFGGGNFQGDRPVAYAGPQWFRDAHGAGAAQYGSKESTSAFNAWKAERDEFLKQQQAGRNPQQAVTTQQTANPSATQEQSKGTMLFMAGMHSRYGNVDPKTIEGQARDYATARGYKFEAIPNSGDDKEGQRKAAMDRIKAGGVTGLYGFSAGGYSARYLHQNMTAEQRAAITHAAIVGAPGVGNLKGWDTRVQDDPSSKDGGHMAGPAALLRSEQARIAAEKERAARSDIMPKIEGQPSSLHPRSQQQGPSTPQALDQQGPSTGWPTPQAPKSDIMPKIEGQPSSLKPKSLKPKEEPQKDKEQKAREAERAADADIKALYDSGYKYPELKKEEPEKKAAGGEIPFRDDEKLNASPKDNTLVTSSKSGKEWQINPNRETVRANLNKGVMEVTPDYKLPKNQRADRGSGQSQDAAPSQTPTGNQGQIAQGKIPKNPPDWSKEHINVKPGSASSDRAYRNAAHFTDGPHYNHGGPFNIIA